MKKCLTLGLLALSTSCVAACSSSTAGHGSVPLINRLSHAAVEKYIRAEFGTVGVTCNNGHDFLMRKTGQQFTCVSSGAGYTVTIKNRLVGTYTVTPTN